MSATGTRGGVGESLLRDDAIPKVTGEFAYSSDLGAAGMLWGDTLRSPHAQRWCAELAAQDCITDVRGDVLRIGLALYHDESDIAAFAALAGNLT